MSTERTTTQRTVLIAAGGTGGHLFPGIAVAEEMRRRHPQAGIVFVGTERGLESKVLPGLGWRLVLMRSTSIKDRRGVRRLAAYARLPLALFSALRILRREDPALVIGVGGYAAGPIVLAAWLLRIPTAIVEPNSIPGLTNRLLGRVARRIFLAFEEAARHFDRSRAIVSGNPVRDDIVALAREERAGEGSTLLVLGGSQGARALNEAMIAAAPRLRVSGLRVVHHAGRYGDAPTLERAYRESGIAAEVLPFIEDISARYAEADLVLARAGATTVAELGVAGVPALFVPYPFAADDHQRHNAEGVVRRGAATMLLERELTGERLARELGDLLAQRGRLEAMGAAMRRTGRPEAARVVVEESWKLIS